MSMTTPTLMMWKIAEALTTANLDSWFYVYNSLPLA